MRRIAAPIVVLAAIALFATPAAAQEDPLQKLVEKLSKQVEQLEKKVGDLGKKLEEQFQQKENPFDFGNLMEKFNDLWNDLELEKIFGDFKMPDLHEMMDKLREQFGDQFGDGFDLEDMMQQFQDQFGGFDMERMMEELKKLFDRGADPLDDDALRLPVCAPTL
jgi:hypothetical protein